MIKVTFHNGQPVSIAPEGAIQYTPEFIEVREFDDEAALLSEFPDFVDQTSEPEVLNVGGNEAPAFRAPNLPKITRPCFISNARHLPNSLMNASFTTLGMYKQTPDYVRGRKVSATYFADREMKDAVVKKSFSDELSDDGNLLGLNIKFEWYSEAGNVAMQKSEFKPMSEDEAQDHLRSRRNRALSHVQSVARRTGQAPYVEMLFAHFADQIAKWEFSGATEELNAALNSDENPSGISQILGAPTVGSDEFANIKEYLIDRLGV